VADYEFHETAMHRQMDTRLGDVILVKIPPSAVFVPIKGYVIQAEQSFTGTISLDPLDQTDRLQIRKELIPRPTRAMRFQSAKLGAFTYQLTSDVEDGGSHWRFDVQKVA